MALRRRSAAERLWAGCGISALAVLIALADQAIEVDVRIAIAEFVPISLAAQCFGFRAGLGLATLVIAQWLHADLERMTSSSPVWSIATNNALRWSVFAYLSWVASKQQVALHQLNAAANYDPLTGLANRRLLDATLRQEIARARRYHQPLSMLFLDVDNLKKANDCAGHIVGDKLLVEIARILQNTRPSDCPARIGGDEMALLLPCTNRSRANTVADRIVGEVQDAAERLELSELGVGVSIGVASWSGSYPLTAAQALQEADEMMYRVKRSRKGVRA